MNMIAERCKLTAYDPGRLLDTLTDKLILKSDAALARTLGVSAPNLSKVRSGRVPVSATLLIRMHEMCGLDIAELRTLMGDRRIKFRIGDQGWRSISKDSAPVDTGVHLPRK